MKIHSTAPDVQEFWMGYKSGIPLLRKVCKKYPGIRHLVRAKNTLQYGNLLKIYAIVCTNSMNVMPEAETEWAYALGRGRIERLINTVQYFADHDEIQMFTGDEFPNDRLGFFISAGAKFMNSLIVADELRILRWCDRRTVPSTSTHRVAATPGVLLLKR